VREIFSGKNTPNHPEVGERQFKVFCGMRTIGARPRANGLSGVVLGYDACLDDLARERCACSNY